MIDMGDKIEWLKWSNGKEWGEISCPMLGGELVMTYWGGGPCYYTYTTPFVQDGEIYCYCFDHDVDGWCEDEQIYLGEYEDEVTCKFS